MKRKNTLNLCLSALFALFAVSMGMAQTFTGNTTNTAGNMAIPSAGTGGCTVAPQTTGGTFFQNTVAGINAAAVLTSVQINLTHTFDSDLDIYLVAPNGQILELSTDNGGGNDNYTNTVFCDNAASSITAGAAPFTGIFRPEGTLVASACGTTVTPTVTTLAAFAAGQNGIWQLQIKDDVGADAGVMLGWSLSFNVPGCTYAGVTLPTLNIAGTDPAVCGASNVQVTVPAGVGNCASSVVSVFVDGVFLINSTPGGVVTIPLLTSGAHTVQYRLSACDLVNQTINVTDGVPPALLCPSNVTYNLDPGACSQFVNYEIFAVDNCPGLNVSMNQNLGWPQAVDIALVCSNAAADALSYYRVFNVAQNLTATSIDLGVWRATPGSPFTIKLWALTGVLNNANLTNLLSTTVYDPAAIVNAQTINIPLTPTQIPAGTNVVVQITSSGTATPQAGSSVGFDLAGESAPTYAYGCLNTAGVPAQLTADIADLNFFSTRGLILQLNMTAPAVTLTQTAGLPSGSEFPIGTTTNCFTAVDYAGNESECCFDVTVLEYPSPVDHLTCNDLVHFSVDADCSGCIGADDVLEGGPYGCYDDYIVELDKTLPYGNGPWVPACVGPADIGKTYQVRVTDPENVNNRCWGSVKIEDKLPPVLSCPTVGLPCNADVSPTANQAFTLSRTANFAIPAAGTVNVNFAIPSNTPVLDVNVSLVTDHTWVGDTRMTLTSPSGTTVVVYDRPGIPVPGGLGCAGDGLDVDFDDEAATPYAVFESTCGNGPAIAGTFQPIELLSGFDGESAAGTWVLSVQDLVGGDGGPNSTATISIATQGGAGFPNGLVYPVEVTGGPTNFTVVAGAGVPTIESCSNVSLSYVDTPVQEDCASGLTQTINRKWTATDASGNSTTCIQVIELFRPTLNDIVLPSDYDGIDAQYFQCTDNAYPTPEWIEGQGLQGFPYVFGVPVGCNINWSYTDYEIPVCDGTYKIRREWSVIDWCIGQGFLYNQIIKVVDEEGPAISCPANMTVSVDPFSCCAFVNLPDVIIEDNCSRINNISGMVVTFDPYTGNQTGMHTFGGNVTDFPGNNHWDLDTLGAFGWTPCLPQGTHTVTYIAEDDCGNTSTCSFRLTVRDYVPPVAACDETTTVAIGVDDPFDCYGPAGPNDVPPALGACEFAGVTWVKATTFDDGSYDHCNGVKFTIRRMAPYSDCILGLNATNGFLPCDDIFPDFPSEFERAIAEQDSIKFYCCEVGTTQTIILRVYQIDVNGNFSVGPDGTPIFNECMIQVEVQDKLKPVCIPPSNYTVTCEQFDPSLWLYGKAQVADNCCLDETKEYQGQCGLTHSVSYTNFDTLCNKGTIVRTFRAFDCHGQSSQCTQRIVVNYEQDYWLRFPNDVIVTVCDGTGNYGEPTFFGEDCELLGVTYHDDVFTVVPDACFKIERTWKIINWCTYNPQLPCINVPNPNPNAITNHPTNLPGPIVSPITTVGDPWRASVVKINPSDALATNYTMFWDANANCYTYKQIIKVIDTQDPAVECPASPVTICDVTPNDPQLWNAMYWWDNANQSHDLCEAPSDICLTATDACSGANINFEYQLFLDLDGDGVMETVVNSTMLGNQPGGLGWNNVWYGNVTGAGVDRAFDGRPVPTNQKWGFALQETVSGNNKTACVKFNTFQQQTTYVTPQLPYGTHKIKWFVTDGCGNETICEYTIIVRDCKAPTVVCLNGLSVNIMPTGMITLWASDFLQYTEDNCTLTPWIKIGIRKCGTGTGFPVDAQGNPITNVNFTCDELGTQCVELWAIDLAGNADYCETYVIVQDNAGNCGINGMVNVSGALKTEATDGVEEAGVTIEGTVSFAPPVTYFDLSDDQGVFQVLNSIPVASSMTITPAHDNNPLNGVTTYDLVLISKHILGIEPLGSAYKMIAADANKSNSITTFDVVELRKLILGIYPELPNNTSWRFVDKAQVFTNPANPFMDQIRENISIDEAMSNQMDEDFVGVKIGDVNNSVVANSLMQADDRTVGTLMFDVTDRDVKAGEVFDVTFNASEKVQGYQMTMNLNGLAVEGIVSNEKVSDNNFGVFADALTVSVDGSETFTVKFRAEKAGKLSEMLGVSSRITKAEGYSLSAGRMEVALRFDGKTIAGVGFELYQNQPNPFVNKTFIGFHLPEATTATLSVYDETGRLVYTQKGDFAKGYNAISLDRALINTTGVLYYTLETATDAATKKMIQSK